MTTAEPSARPVRDPLNTQNPVKAAPSGGFLGRLRVGQKLTLLSVALALPVGILLYTYVQAQNEDLAFTRQEIRGTEYLVPLKTVLQNIQKHRGLSSGLLGGDASFNSTRAAMVVQVEASLDAVAAQDARYGAEFKTTEALKKLRESWNTLETFVSAAKASPALQRNSTDRHTRLIAEQILPLFITVADNSNLTLDPQIATFYSMNMTTRNIPQLTEGLGQTRAYGINAVSRKVATPDEKGDLRFFLRQAQARLDELQGDISRAVAGNENAGVFKDADFGGEITEAGNLASSATQSLLTLFTKEVLEPERINISSKAYFDTATKAIDTQFALYDTALGELEHLLGIRLNTTQNALNTALIGIGLLLILVSLLALSIVRAITRPVGQLVRVVERVGQGDLTQKAPISSGDEIGVLARQVNSSIDLLRDTAKRNEVEQQRATTLQNNIGEFLNVTMDISGGDLTKRGKVSEDVLGNVVDSINVMTEELGYTLKDVRNVSNDVSNSSSSVLLSTQNITSSAENTALATAQVALEVQEVGQSIARMASDASEASEAAKEALEAAQQGQQAVDSTLTGMQAIRREVQSISKRIKSLGDRSLEISEIVDTISRISAQTNLIALNAAIEASGAGSAGSRFAIVADEVRKLAESSSQATGRIAGLIKTVQNEVSEVVSSVEDGTREVEEGYRVASVAGERLKELSEIAQISARFAEQISSGAREQVLGVARVGEAVGRIALATEQAKLSVLEGKNEAEKLQTLAGQLNENLSRFQLPA